MNWIKLHVYDDNIPTPGEEPGECFVNADYFMSLVKKDEVTAVVLHEGNISYVKETPEEILKLINEL